MTYMYNVCVLFFQRASSDPLLKGVHAGSMNDVIHRNWLSKLCIACVMYKQERKVTNKYV